jgi:uncharacterized protein YndB with AHSA1/START domain
VERLLQAPPARIFAAWTDPDVLMRWWAAEPDWTGAEAITDPRVGGRYRLSMQDTAGKLRTVVGEYLEVEPPRRLVYTWRWEPHGEDGLHEDDRLHVQPTIVAVNFVPEGSATRVILEQRGFVDRAARDSHDDGWNGCLDNLERRVIADATSL